MLGYTKILSWSAKWLGSDEVMYDSLRNDMCTNGTGTVEEWMGQSDERLCSTLYDLFNEADILVAHNAVKFDIKHMNTRWMALGFAPPQPYKVFDTLLSARSVFNFPSNSLDGLARYLKCTNKLSNSGFSLWTGCMAGDAKSWDEMEEYNIGDVLTLEEVYIKLRAWDKRHPNVGLIAGSDVTRCVTCGGTAMHEISKSTFTNVSEFPTYRCDSCGHVMRGRKRYKPTLPIDEQVSHAQ